MDPICGFNKAWEKLKPRLRSQGWLVTNQERFVVKRQIFKKREDGEDNRSSVIAIRAVAFENEVSNQERTTLATHAEAADARRRLRRKRPLGRRLPRDTVDLSRNR
jgi:hypothetical protein